MYEESIYGPDIIRACDVPKYAGISKRHVYRLVAQGKFPAPWPLVYGSTVVGWKKAEVIKWRQEREAKSK